MLKRIHGLTCHSEMSFLSFWTEKWTNIEGKAGDQFWTWLVNRLIWMNEKIQRVFDESANFVAVFVLPTVRLIDLLSACVASMPVFSQYF